MKFIALFLITGLVFTQAARAVDNDTIIRNLTGQTSRAYPTLPVPPSMVQGRAVDEMIKDREVLAAMSKMASESSRSADRNEAIEKLTQKKAVWCLQVLLCYPNQDVQVLALRSLARLKDESAVPFLLIYGDYIDVIVAGSENATIHGVLLNDCVQTLAALTGLEPGKKSRYQDVEGLHKFLRRCHAWLGAGNL